MRRTSLVLLAVLAIWAAPAGAITNGTPDGNLHPNVDALLADYDDESPGPDILCSGTLIAPRVFLTASHCTAFLESIDVTEVWVTFAPDYDEDTASRAGIVSGQYFTHPLWGTTGGNNTFDIAAVVLNEPPGVTPAQLPRVGLLDSMRRTLANQQFTAVGYGTSREDPKRKGPNTFFFDGVRRNATQSFHSLLRAWLDLSMNSARADGGTCYGDSGGPHFLGGGASNLIVSVTVTGDAACRSLDKTYRIDTPWARDFLEQFPGVDYPG